MIILRVAMGHGWLKETVKEINTMPTFTASPMVHEQSQGVRVMIYNTAEGPISGPGTPADSDMSAKKHMGVTGVASFV